MGSLDRWAIGALLGIALVLRVPGHLSSGLWLDEILTYLESVRLPLGSLVTTFGSDNNHPLYSLSAKLSVHLLGENALALRLPALVFGVASVPALYLYALRVTSRGEAMAAALLMATSFHHVWFSQNARGYTLLLLLTLIATLLFESLLVGRGRWHVVAYGVALGLAVYTHASAVFLAVAHFFAFLLQGRVERPRRRLGVLFSAPPLLGLGLGAGVALMLYGPMLGSTVEFFLQPSGEGRGGLHGSAQMAMALAVIQSTGLGLGIGLVAASAAISILTVGVASHWRQSPIRLILLLAPGALVGLVVLWLGRPVRPRFFFFLAGFLLLLLVRGVVVLAQPILDRVRRRWGARTARLVAFGVAAGLVGCWLVPLPRAYVLPKQDFGRALAWIEERRRPGEPVLTTGAAARVYRDFFRTDFTWVESLTEAEAIVEESVGVYFLITLPEELRPRSAELAAGIRSRGVRVARFSGSVVGGDIVVYRVLPRGVTPPRAPQTEGEP